MRDAVAIVIKKGDRFLLIKRAKIDAAVDYWCPITGEVEHGETQEQAVVREAHEEMGFRVKPLRRVWECFTADKHYRLHWWHVQLLDDTVVINPDEVKDYRWVDYDEMKNIDKMFEADLRFFREVAPHLPDS
jgi:8-oxo-dGTP pyrophosphatase MutT (NUDIX family)